MLSGDERKIAFESSSSSDSEPENKIDENKSSKEEVRVESPGLKKVEFADQQSRINDYEDQEGALAKL